MLRKIDISHKTIFFITAFLLGIWILYQIRDVILVMFVALIFMSALSPFVEKLVSWKFPKGVAIALIYLVIIGLISLLVFVIINPLIEQTASLAVTIPDTIQHVMPPGTVNRNILEERLADISQNAANFALAIFTNIITVVSIGVLTFYLLLDKDRFENLIAQLSISNQEKTKKLIGRIEDMLGAWLRGQLILSLVIGVLSYGLLFALQVPYALPLAIIAGILEIVPVIGPAISAIPAILIALVTFETPFVALLVGLGYILIQQLENHIVVPQVMKRAVGLNPLVVILAITIGSRLLGIAGALLAVPITVVCQIIITEVIKGDSKAVLK